MPNNAIPKYKRDKIFRRILEGHLVGHIANEMGISVSTVKRYRKIVKKIIAEEIERINQIGNG